jgi:dephospho-CoA kinase
LRNDWSSEIIDGGDVIPGDANVQFGVVGRNVPSSPVRISFRSRSFSPADTPLAPVCVTATDSKVPVIGLVGGIGSGKSRLAKELRKIRHVEIVEGDVAGHEVLQENSVKEKIRSEFGDGVFDSQGGVDRRRMSELVFGLSPAAQAAKSRLEAIVHPRIKEKLADRITAARARPGVELVVLDAAVLLEAGWRCFCDLVIFVDVPEQQRFERVARTRGWTEEEFRAREASQLPLERKRMEADDVIDNSQSPKFALSQLDAALFKTASPKSS